MTKISLITVGSLKEDYLKSAVEEYKKRLSLYTRVEEINIKEERIKDEGSSGEIERALSIEGDKILSALPKDPYKIALCIEGSQYSSLELASIISKAEDKCGKISLIIGSSHGLCPKVKQACDLRLSFSKMTFPHRLARIMLLEQIYRGYKINSGEAYHK